MVLFRHGLKALWQALRGSMILTNYLPPLAAPVTRKVPPAVAGVESTRPELYRLRGLIPSLSSRLLSLLLFSLACQCGLRSPQCGRWCGLRLSQCGLLAQPLLRLWSVRCLLLCSWVTGMASVVPSDLWLGQARFCLVTVAGSMQVVCVPWHNILPISGASCPQLGANGGGPQLSYSGPEAFQAKEN